jgi:hypothetical protein
MARPDTLSARTALLKERWSIVHGPWSVVHGAGVLALIKWVFGNFWIMAAGASARFPPNRACLYSESAPSVLATYGSIVQKFWRHASVPDPDRPNAHFVRDCPLSADHGCWASQASPSTHGPMDQGCWPATSGYSAISGSPLLGYHQGSCPVEPVCIANPFLLCLQPTARLFRNSGDTPAGLIQIARMPAL